MTLSEHQRCFTAMVADLITWAYAQGYELTFGEAYRTKEQQSIYVKQGKSRTMNSAHLKRLAIDVNLFVDGTYQSSSKAYASLGAYWKSLDSHNVWGGDWTGLVDGNHFERKP